MAEAYGGVVEHWRVKVVGEVASQAESSVTVRSTALWCSVGWGYDVWGSVASASVAGQSSGQVEFHASSATGASVETAVASTEATFERRGADYTVRCGASATLQGGYHDGTSSASVDVTVPARVLVRPGAPALSAPKSAGPGQKVAISWAKASTQGNAAFLRFELYENGARVYSGSATSAERTPSAASSARVTYELREVHSWFGEEVYSSSKAEVSIVQLTMPGAPGLSASRSQVQVGDRVTLSWRKADSQGNAAFARFELRENGALVYSGSATSAKRTPSDAEGDSVAYELREVHAFYGREVYTTATVRVSVVRLAAPTAPDLVSPASGSTVTHPRGVVGASWRHNAVDATTQAGAQVAYGRSQAGPWSVLDVAGGSASADIPVDGDGDYYWRVRTRGAFDGGADPSAAWSPWSSVGYFRARTPPRVSVSLPGSLTDLPLVVSWSFSDAMGSQAQATVRVSRSGELLASRTVAGAQSASFPASELSVSSGQVLSVTVEARSTTGLSGKASGSVGVDLLPPATPTVALRYDWDAMAVVVRYAPGEDGGAAATSALEVYRGDKRLAGSGPGPGSVVDATPPLDGAVEYTVRARAGSGSSCEARARIGVPSGGRFAFNWGDGNARCATAAYDARLSEERGIESEEFDAAAYEYPVEVYGTHRTHRGSLSATVLKRDPTRASVGAWREAASWGGGYVMRAPGGMACWVSASVKISEGTGGGGSVSVDWEERAYDGVL